MKPTPIVRSSNTGARLTRVLAPFAGLALLALPSLAQAAPRDPSGVWLTEDGKARIRVEKCGPQNTNICGYAVWLRTPLNDEGKPRIDFRNPDPKKRTRASLGHQLIMGLKGNADGHYEGKIYNAEDGKFYDVTVWTEEPGELTVRGCLLSFLCKSQTWTQKTDIAQGQLSGPTNGANGPRADAEWAPKGNVAAGAEPATTGATGNAKQAAAGQKPAAKPAAKTPTPNAEPEE